MQCIYGLIPGTHTQREREEMKKVKQNMQTAFAQKDFANMLRRILIDGSGREGSMNVLSH